MLVCAVVFLEPCCRDATVCMFGANTVRSLQDQSQKSSSLTKLIYNTTCSGGSQEEHQANTWRISQPQRHRAVIRDDVDVVVHFDVHQPHAIRLHTLQAGSTVQAPPKHNRALDGSLALATGSPGIVSLQASRSLSPARTPTHR